MKIDLFRAGAHVAMGGQQIEFSEADVAAIAAAYNPSVHEAPVVIGHPKHDAPAYGWVASLSAEGGRLSAEAAEVEPAFAELVEKGRYKKVSASFYPPDSPANPTPGSYHLRHVGFLGAQPPSVKGLSPVHFADGVEDGLVTLEFSEEELRRQTSWLARNVASAFRALRDWMIDKEGKEVADRVLPQWTDESAAEVADRLQSSIEGSVAPAFAEELAEQLAAADTQDAGAGADTLQGGEGQDTGSGGEGQDTVPADTGADTLQGGGGEDTASAGDALDTATGGAGADSVEGGQGGDPLPADRAAAAFAEREARLAEQVADFNARQAAARKREDAQLLDGLVGEGRLAPGWRDQTAAFLERLDAEATVEFAEGGEAETSRDFFIRLLKSGGTVIDFGEASAPSKAQPAAGDKTARLATRARVLVGEAKAQGRTLSFAEAVGIAEREEEL